MQISKHRIVMDLHTDQHTKDFVYFEAEKVDEERTDGYYMTRELFEDFGSPETITVSVEPGDLLNPPDPIQAGVLS